MHFCGSNYGRVVLLEQGRHLRPSRCWLAWVAVYSVAAALTWACSHLPSLQQLDGLLPIQMFSVALMQTSGSPAASQCHQISWGPGGEGVAGVWSGSIWVTQFCLDLRVSYISRETRTALFPVEDPRLRQAQLHRNQQPLFNSALTDTF